MSWINGIAYDRGYRLAGTLVYFPGLDIEEQRAVIGDDPFPLSLAAMGRNIERAIQGSVEQGLLRSPLPLADVDTSSSVG